MDRHAGQSLVETAIVLSVLGILTMAAVPSLLEWSRGRRANAFASLLHTELSLARNTAIVRGHRTVLCRSTNGEQCQFSGPWTRGFLSFVDVDGNGDRSSVEPVLRVAGSAEFHQLHVGISESRRIITFRPDGRGGGTNLTAVVCDASGTARRTVVISVAGRVRLGQPSANQGCT